MFRVRKLRSDRTGQEASKSTFDVSPVRVLSECLEAVLITFLKKWWLVTFKLVTFKAKVTLFLLSKHDNDNHSQSTFKPSTFKPFNTHTGRGGRPSATSLGH